MFVPIEEPTSHYQAATADFWKTYQGIEVGEQYPWSNPNQRIVWEAPTFKNLIEAWDGLELMKPCTPAVMRGTIGHEVQNSKSVTIPSRETHSPQAG
jgi:hypothetical protein